MSSKVMTVCGYVPTSELGITSMHEHLVLGMPGFEFDSSYTRDKDEIIRLCVEHVMAAKAYGLNTVVDATPADLTREPEIYKAVQEQTGVNIICSTGLYTEAHGSSAFWRLLAGSKGYDVALKRLSDSYIRDIEVGIDGTDVKAALIKLSVGAGKVTEFEAMSVHAGALAQKATGAHIISHTGSPDMGPVLAEMLKNHGADMGKTMIGHMCDTDDIDLLVKTLDYGVYLGLDRFGLDSVMADEKKCQTLSKLVEMGYIEKLLIGHDSTIFNHAGHLMPNDVFDELTDWNYCGLFRTFLHRMKELGLTDEQIHTLLVTNPRRFFEA